jgi:hypothetical protein
MVAHIFGMVFMCLPIASNWDPAVPKGKCINLAVFTLVMCGFTIVTDLATLAVPFWIFLELRMARKAKVALLIVFALGFM